LKGWQTFVQLVCGDSARCESITTLYAVTGMPQAVSYDDVTRVLPMQYVADRTVTVGRKQAVKPKAEAAFIDPRIFMRA
jgi:hypothetical protein